eukprot:TRINITY_DN1175_c0_g1_i1.p1 TRINITY_DN1175_c0_g1~~TRINITY_DN1175_c0_g1_i1.p1  ORF type:complete len:214 (+),score=59.09 TRINITY_DN1175_c0_g1_i1:312-953(+)
MTSPYNIDVAWNPRNRSPAISSSSAVSSSSPRPQKAVGSAAKKTSAKRAGSNAKGQAPRKRKPGPMRKKCVWCSLTHGHFCSAGKCAVRARLGGIGTDDLLETCRALKEEFGEDLRLALEMEGEAGVMKLKKKASRGGSPLPSTSKASRPSNAGVKKSPKTTTKTVKKSKAPINARPVSISPTKVEFDSSAPFVDKLAILSLVCQQFARTQTA